MKIAVPCDDDAGLDARRSGHFGHCSYFVVVTVEDGAIEEVSSIPNLDHDAVGCSGVIAYVLEQGFDAILTAGMGPRPLSRFTEGGIDVYFETSSPQVKGAIEHFLAGDVALMRAEDACPHN